MIDRLPHCFRSAPPPHPAAENDKGLVGRVINFQALGPPLRQAALRHRSHRRKAATGSGSGRGHHGSEAERLLVSPEVLVAHQRGLCGVEVDNVTCDPGAVSRLATPGDWGVKRLP